MLNNTKYSFVNILETDLVSGKLVSSITKKSDNPLLQMLPCT